MNKRIRTISLIIVVVSLISVGASFGLFKENTNKVENTFIRAKEQNIVINETFDGLNKENVYFDVYSDTPTNLRVKLVFYFLDEENNIETVKPIEGIDYDLTINEEWIYYDGYYYINYPLNSTSTPILIKELKNLNTNYKLGVDILAQTISEID